jgi:hypothetical protein
MRLTIIAGYAVGSFRGLYAANIKRQYSLLTVRHQTGRARIRRACISLDMALEVSAKSSGEAFRMRSLHERVLLIWLVKSNKCEASEVGLDLTLRAKKPYGADSDTPSSGIAESEREVTIKASTVLVRSHTKKRWVATRSPSEIAREPQLPTRHLLNVDVEWSIAVEQSDVPCPRVCNQGRVAACRGSTGGTTDIRLMPHKLLMCDAATGLPNGTLYSEKRSEVP